MKKNVVSEIVMTLLLITMLTFRFCVPLSFTNINISPCLSYNGATQEIDIEKSSASIKLHERVADIMGADKWRDFAKADTDSIEILVGLSNAEQNSCRQLKHLIVESQGTLVDEMSIKGQTVALVADVPIASVFILADKVRNSRLSRYIEPNLKFQAFSVPNDPYWAEQWGPVKIEADYAWNTTRGNSSILVAVIDTGVDWQHSDLVANYVSLGYDWVNSDADPRDDNGHGTHCTGIIAAALNNSLGIAGLAQVHIMAEKGLDSWGTGTADDLANAIIHAVDQGANIISCSWGGYIPSTLIHEAVEYAYERDVLVVAAAGNSQSNRRAYPAAYEEVVAVSATDENDNPATFTNFGEWIELAAPGVNIYSTYNGNSYAHESGTSMSCPHVAGVAALAWSEFPDAVRDWVRLRLRYTADDLGDLGFDSYYGHGRINARRTVEEDLPDHDNVISSWQSPPYVDSEGEVTASATVVNFGKENEAGVTIQLLANGSVVDSTIIESLASHQSATVNFSWIPTIEGIFNITSYVVPLSGETTISNNAMSRYLFVGIKTIAVPLFCSTIQEAVDTAGSGFTIRVGAGTYYEHVVVDKEVYLIGENRDATIIDADQKGSAVIVVASNVTVANFTVRNSGFEWYDSGILLSSSNEVTLRDNKMTNNNFGVYLWSPHNCRFNRNNVASNAHYGFSADLPFNCTFSENLVTYNFDGITLYSSSNSTVCENNVANNLESIVLVSCQNNTLSGNNIANGAIGLGIASNSTNNVFFHNNFLNNTVQADVETTDANVWNQGYSSGGNYWSNYSGLDLFWGASQDQLGSDGIGDTPYVIDVNNQDNYPLMSDYEYWSNPIPGDINRDTNVDSKDLTQLIASYGSTAIQPNWNPNCDINNDSKVDYKDLHLQGKNYGKTYF